MNNMDYQGTVIPTQRLNYHFTFEITTNMKNNPKHNNQATLNKPKEHQSYTNKNTSFNK